jgi:hypothetical protein
VPTINVKKCRRCVPWPLWGFRSPSRMQKCALSCMGMKEILLMDSIPPALSSVMAGDPLLIYGAWVIQCETIYVMIMALFRGMHRLDPHYSVVSVREAKYTRLGYRTRLSKLHTLYPPFSISFSRSSHSAILDPQQENNQGIPD